MLNWLIAQLNPCASKIVPGFSEPVVRFLDLDSTRTFAVGVPLVLRDTAHQSLSTARHRQV